MQLIYRGTTYDYNALKASSRPTPRTTPYTLSYQGETYQVTPQSQSQAPATPVRTVSCKLIYRGNVYWVNRTVASSKALAGNQHDRSFHAAYISRSHS